MKYSIRDSTSAVCWPFDKKTPCYFVTADAWYHSDNTQFYIFIRIYATDGCLSYVCAICGFGHVGCLSMEFGDPRKSW